MKAVNNERGVTLVEVLAAMAILSIILVSVMNIFPQMGMMNTVNEDKAQGISSAKELLLEWQNNNEVKTYISNPDTTILLSLVPPQLEDGFYIFETTHGEFTGNIKIQQEPSKTSELSNAHLIIVQLLNDKNKIVSETYGYILI
ncbi:prepilin-type N-terminal cleavage/methylation domain-containing protein [Mesobacillus maritimus]|uniref:PulJ/GspJ family protein n=1 Tax=Mesobacillus maritimus TaxID=1643336 RepID=UPI00203D9BF5|nr:prepilin-type N-terminal cleavage/methylation domain-containing protein [Mesobacillus maritimus]MCM3587655.1 prepilin-type N-terminal cleavage/methylation domain-containing protein [Mesobacillus maritimus]